MSHFYFTAVLKDMSAQNFFLVYLGGEIFSFRYSGPSMSSPLSIVCVLMMYWYHCSAYHLLLVFSMASASYNFSVLGRRRGFHCEAAIGASAAFRRQMPQQE